MLEGPLGMKLMIRNMAIREGLNLDELDPYSLEKDDPVKAEMEELMCAMGITAQDLKDGVIRGPQDDDDYDEWYRIHKYIPPMDGFTDWPKLAQEEDPWRKYRDANGQIVPPIFNKSKKLDDDDDDVPIPAGGDDKQMDDDEIKKMKNDDDVLLCLPSVITRGCKRTNDDEIKKKKKKKDDGAAAAAADKQAEG